MPHTWFTADFHFGHSNIIRYCNRPFGDVAEMDQAILERLNSLVRAHDVLYFLGDFCIGGKARALAYRNGIRCKRIFALPGNHDMETRKLTDTFSWLNNLQKYLYTASPSCSVTMPCGSGIAPITGLGIYMGILTGTSPMYLLHFLWMSEWTPMISARGTSTRSGHIWPRE
jgi:hypothetical protein